MQSIRLLIIMLSFASITACKSSKDEASQNPPAPAFEKMNFSETNYIYSPNSRSMLQVKLNADGTGRIANNNGASDVTYTSNPDSTQVQLVLKTPIVNVGFPTVDGQQVATEFKLKFIMIEQSNSVKLTELFDTKVIDPIDPAAAVSSKTEVTENMTYAKVFDKSINVKQGDTLALRVLGAGESQAIHFIVVSLTGAETGKVEEKAALDISDDFIWKLEQNNTVLAVKFLNGLTMNYKLIQDSTPALVVSEKVISGVVQAVSYDYMVKDLKNASIDVNSFSGSYKAVSLGVTEPIVQTFEADGTGLIDFGAEYGGFSPLSWTVDSNINAVIAKRYREIEGFNADGSPILGLPIMGEKGQTLADLKEQMLTCSQTPSPCFEYQKRTLRVLGKIENDLLVYRKMEMFRESGNTSTIGDVWIFKK